MAAPLLTPDLIASLKGLELKARTVVESLLVGQHRSRKKGYSSQFAEHREYSPGDDLRYVDWKLFGKRDRYYIRQFEDETRLRAWLMIDCSRSMYYRSLNAPLSKLEYALVLAAAIGSTVLRQRDEVGASLVGEEVETLGPQGQPSHLKELITFLERQIARIPDRFLLSNQLPTPAAGNSPAILERLIDQIPPRSMVIWITDAFLAPQELRTVLTHLRHRRHDLRMLQLADPAEADFPFDTPTLFRGLEGGGDQMIAPRAIREAYLSEWDQFLQETRQQVRQAGGDHLYVRTDAAFDSVLSEWLL